MDILVIFRLLLRRIWILVLVPLTASIIAFYFKFNSQRSFRSVLQLATGFTTNDQIRVTDERFSLYEADVKFNNLIETINSPNSISLLSYKLLLHDLGSQPFRLPKEVKLLDDKELIQSARLIATHKLDSMLLLNPQDVEQRKVAALLKNYGYDFKSLKKNLTVRRVNFTDFIGIEFASENPKLSAFIVNNLADEFLRYYTLSKTERSGESVEFFKDLVDQKRQELDVKAEQLREYKSSNSVLNYELESASKLDQINDLENLRNQKEEEINAHRLSIRRLDEQINKLSSGGANTSVATDNRVIVSLREHINALNSRYIAGGSSDRVLLDSIVYLREQLRKEMSALSSTREPDGQSPSAKLKELINKKTELETLLEIAETNLTSVQAKLNILRYNVSGYANKEAVISDLQREVDVASQEYLEAQEKFNMAKNSALTGNPIRVILRGTAPAEPEPSKTIMVTLLAGVASFFLCAFTIIIIEFLDQRIKSPLYFQKVVNMPLVGTLNGVKNPGDFAFLFDKSITEPSLVTFKQLVRKLRFEIERHNAKVILVTSTKQGEGKSFLVLALSFSLSLIQKKVLIIDTNFKNTVLTKLLVKSKFKKLKAGSESPEVAELLSHEAYEDQENERDFISLTKYKNIHVIGSRIDNDSPSEILSGRDFVGMLGELRNQYDYIFMEGAAMNEFPDTKELIGYSDKILAVFSADSAIKQLDKDSISYLNQYNGKLIGAVLNRVEVKNLDV